MAGKFIDVTLRLIDKATSPLNKIGGKLKDNANQWAKAGKQIQNAGNSISAVGGKMTKTLTMPIVGVGTAAVKVASDFEKGMSTVKSISGATGKDLDALAAKAKEMGAKTKFSATEATDAFKFMGMAGWNAGQMMDGIEGIMHLAGATGEDLASTSDIVTDALTAFGMSAKDTNKFVDVLAQTANRSNTDVGMLGESFKYVAPVAGSLKYNVQDVSTALGVMANSGIKASTAGTSLRSWMSRMAAPTDAVASAMKKVGISLTDSNGKTKDFMTVMKKTRAGFSKLTEAQKAQYASALAGKTGMSGLLAIVNASDSDFDKLAESIYNSEGACEKMYNVANDNLQGQLTILKSTVESIAISFGERMTPYVKKATEWLQKLAEKFNSLSPKQQDMIIKIGLVVAAIGPALLVFGKMVTTVGKVVSIVGKVGKAFKTFGTIAGLISSPAGIVIVVLGAIVAAGVLIYKNWDKIKKTAKKVFGYVGRVFKSCGVSGESMKKKLEPITEKFGSIASAVKKMWKLVSPIFGAMGEAVGLLFKTIIGGAIGAAAGYFKVFFDTATTVINGVLSVFDGIIKFVSGVFTGNWKKAWEGVKEIFSGVFSSFVALCKAPINSVIAIINGAISGINKLGLKIPDWVPVLGGKDFSINIPKIPQLYKGTNGWQGGLVQVHERGGEVMDLPKGTRVYPHDKSIQMAYEEGKKAKRAAEKIEINLPKQIFGKVTVDISENKLLDKIEKAFKPNQTRTEKTATKKPIRIVDRTQISKTETVKEKTFEKNTVGKTQLIIKKIADQIVIREEADIDKLAEKIVNKLEKVSENMGGDIDGYIPELG